MFRGLSPDDLEALATELVERDYRAGEAIFAQGDAGEEMFFILQGGVNIHLPGEGSRRVSLKDLAVGEYFGELALFDDRPRSASALATTETRVAILGRGALSHHLEKRPESSIAILRTISE